jgi:hypothetical protein
MRASSRPPNKICTNDDLWAAYLYWSNPASIKAEKVTDGTTYLTPIPAGCNTRRDWIQSYLSHVAHRRAVVTALLADASKTQLFSRINKSVVGCCHFRGRQSACRARDPCDAKRSREPLWWTPNGTSRVRSPSLLLFILFSNKIRYI